ncbi:50S ribosomal protein L9 [Spirochaeta cellobiosiphila]|uniref:50S ribosomal protein L9 n=1 Tax=Spirochaeta cellobiosiphila TaxID=504483 RepID=UPI000413D930|nr:50S ribosomal protein L9 [Spirochaeta cellobiosiphila]
MKVILQKDVENLGEEGDVCVVKDGYGRNYLLPQGFATLYSKNSLEILNQKKGAIERRKAEKQKEAMSLKDKLESLTLLFEMPAGDNGKLFGAVNNASIVEALAKESINIPRKSVEVPNHSIKLVGAYSVRVKLYGKESAKLTVEVKAEENAE